MSLNTQKAIAAYPTEFSVTTEKSDSNTNITKYEWDFGDNAKTTTSEGKVEHTYNSIGDFKMVIKVTDTKNLSSSKTFDVRVETPKDAVNSVLSEKLNNLENVNSQITEFPAYHKQVISEILGLKEIEENLSDLQRENITAIEDEDYVDIMAELIKLRVPNSIFETNSANGVSVYPNREQIDLEILKEIAGGDYTQNERNLYVDAVLAWDFENIKAELYSKGYSASYGESVEHVLNFFSLTIVENGWDGDSFLIIPKLENLDFSDNYNERESSDYFYIELNGEDNKKIEFSTTEDTLFSDLPVFISPSISNLVVIDSDIEESKDKLSKPVLIILATLFAIFVGVIAYLLLQQWYKKKYEDYLFKDKNQIYNIVSYIENAKSKGIDVGKISDKLREAGWSSEQVTYVMRKYAGKRTGLVEIPIDKLFGKGKKDEKTGSQFRKSPPKRY